MCYSYINDVYNLKSISLKKKCSNSNEILLRNLKCGQNIKSTLQFCSSEIYK